MTARAERHDPCLGVAVRTGGERVVQPAGQGEVPDVVGRELQLPAAVGQLMRWQRHHSGVVDEQVQRPVPGGDEGAHGVEVGEVESADARRPGCRSCARISTAVRSPAAVSRTASITSAPARRALARSRCRCPTTRRSRSRAGRRDRCPRRRPRSWTRRRTCLNHGVLSHAVSVVPIDCADQRSPDPGSDTPRLTALRRRIVWFGCQRRT